MARIIVGSYMVRFPLGGYLSWVLQWLLGFHQLGHDVYFVEKSGWSDACYNPAKDTMSDDCTYGIRVVDALLSRFGLQGRWCFVDVAEHYHGLSRVQIEAIFKSADLFVDMGTHGAWLNEAADAGIRVLVDGEPGTTQMKMEERLAAGKALPDYDYYYSVGQNIATGQSTVPTAGKHWRKLFFPIIMSLIPYQYPDPEAPFTTIMSWQAHEPFEFEGRTYGQKDVEF
ncbi:hypothetical protein ACFL6S_36030, partial [Candidatus Poribacteria bacterium]